MRRLVLPLLNVFLFASCSNLNTGRSAGGRDSARDSSDEEQAPSSVAPTEALEAPPPATASAPAPILGEEAPVTCHDTDATICAMAQEIFRLVNAERARPTRDRADHRGPQKSMPPLRFGPKWSYVAQSWTAEQATRRRIGHDGFPTERTAVFTRTFGGTKPLLSAENVAMSTANPATAAVRLFRLWRDSDGHYKNMMTQAPVLGVGIAQAADGAWYGTQLFGDE